MEIISFVFGVATAAYLIVRTFVLRGLEHKALARAEELSETGDHRGALSAFVEALAAWGPNVAHATPAMLIKDYGRLRQLLVRLYTEARKLGVVVDISAAQKVAARAADIYQDRDNLTFISHDLKPDAALEMSALVFQLKNAREAITRRCLAALVHKTPAPRPRAQLVA